MARISLQRSPSGEFELPASCLKCASCVDLKSESRQLHRSTLLQGLALLPWLVGAPLASDAAGAYFLTAMFASIAILYAAGQNAKVRTYICAECRSARRRHAILGSVVGAFGLFVTFYGPTVTHNAKPVLAGLSLMFAAGIGVFIAQGSSQFKLLSRKRDVAVLEVSDRSPIVWQAKNPSL